MARLKSYMKILNSPTTVEAAARQSGSRSAPRSGISARTACPAGGSSR